jgi:ankyrin repeat protein
VNAYGEFEEIRDRRVDTLVKTYVTPLHVACYFAQLTVVDFLMESGANVESDDGAGQAPLSYAANNGTLDVVKSLVSHHAKIDRTDTENWSALHFAADRSDGLDIVKYLLANRANDNIRIRGGDRFVAAQIAASNGQVDVLKYFLETIGVRKGIGWSLAAFYLINDDGIPENQAQEMIALLLDNRLVDINWRDPHGGTYLRAAIHKRNQSTVLSLLQRSANPLARDMYGKMALQAAWEVGWE